MSEVVRAWKGSIGAGSEIITRCPDCSKPLVRRAGMFWWRGVSSDGAVCPSVYNHGLWSIVGEEMEPLRPQPIRSESMRNALKFPVPKHSDVADWLAECADVFDALPAGKRPGQNGYRRAHAEITRLRADVSDLLTQLQSKIHSIAGEIKGPGDLSR